MQNNNKIVNRESRKKHVSSTQKSDWGKYYR